MQSVAAAQIGEPETGRESRLNLVNLAFLGIAMLFLLCTLAGGDTVQPLVQADSKTARRIEHLERTLLQQPGSVDSALELAQIYRDAGEFPFSYDALRSAEQTGTLEPGWQLKLGLAYLQLGKNDDALRVLRGAAGRCRRGACPDDVRVKLEIFERVATRFKERRIAANKHRTAAEQVLQQVLKPVQVDPAKMRPKAPAEPAAAPPAKRR